MSTEKENSIFNKVSKAIMVATDAVANAANDATHAIGGAANKTAAFAADTYNNAITTVTNALDQNGDGQINADDLIILGMKAPGVHIRRDVFLRKELSKNHSKEVVNDAIARTPALAGIPADEIDKIADSVIIHERNSVSGISAALGAPGGWAMLATVPADLVQYYGFTLRAVQQLLYLYGFPEIDVDDKEGIQLDSDTINQITLCLAVMQGVAGANNVIKAIANALAKGVEKKLLKAALTKGAIYPFIKSFMSYFGVRMTKAIFAGAVKKAIPVVGGLVGGGITFFSFAPACKRLKDSLKDTFLSNPKGHQITAAESEITEAIVTGEAIIIDEELQNNVPDPEAYQVSAEDIIIMDANAANDEEHKDPDSDEPPTDDQ